MIDTGCWEEHAALVTLLAGLWLHVWRVSKRDE